MSKKLRFMLEGFFDLFEHQVFWKGEYDVHFGRASSCSVCQQVKGVSGFRTKTRLSAFGLFLVTMVAMITAIFVLEIII